MKLKLNKLKIKILINFNFHYIIKKTINNTIAQIIIMKKIVVDLPQDNQDLLNLQNFLQILNNLQIFYQNFKKMKYNTNSRMIINIHQENHH